MRLALFVALVALVACAETPAAEDGCVVTGCSSQLCADEESVSTCEEIPHRACYAAARCARQAGGQCGWDQTSELVRCLAE